MKSLTVFSFVFLLFFTLSCSYQTVSSKKTEMELKISYIQGKETNVAAPLTISFLDFDTQTLAVYQSKKQQEENNRGIASISLKEEVLKETKTSNMSNRKAYFSALLEQYVLMKELNKKQTIPIKYCPAFHEDLLAQNQKTGIESFVPRNFGLFHSLANENFQSPQLSKLYPELLLPLEKGKTTTGPLFLNLLSTRTKVNKGEIMALGHRALQEYTEQIYDEILLMCETGVGSNYFLFENLSQQMETLKEMAIHQRFELFGKIPPVANVLLLYSLLFTHYESNQIQFFSYFPRTQEILKRLKISHEITAYLSYWSSLRTGHDSKNRYPTSK